MSRAAIITAFVLGFVASVATAEKIVLSGAPETKIKSSAGSTNRSDLSASEVEQYTTVIVKRGEEYFWASREGRELRHETSGKHHYFIDPSGGGYIKVEVASDGQPPFRYYEHMSLGLATITYWGHSSEFSP